MARDDIGRCPCPMCRRSVPVRKNKKGRLYLYCGPVDGFQGCGMLQPNLPGGQDWILEHATIGEPAPGQPWKAGNDGEGEPVKEEKRKEVPKEKQPPPKKRNFLESLLTLDE